MKKINRNQVKLTTGRIEAIKAEVTSTVTKRTFEDVMPLMLTYLMDNFHCGYKGLFKFMDWFDRQMAIINEDPYRLYDYIERLKQEAGVRIEYD